MFSRIFTTPLVGFIDVIRYIDESPDNSTKLVRIALIMHHLPYKQVYDYCYPIVESIREIYNVILPNKMQDLITRIFFILNECCYEDRHSRLFNMKKEYPPYVGPIPMCINIDYQGNNQQQIRNGWCMADAICGIFHVDLRGAIKILKEVGIENNYNFIPLLSRCAEVDLLMKFLKCIDVGFTLEYLDPNNYNAPHKVRYGDGRLKFQLSFPANINVVGMVFIENATIGRDACPMLYQEASKHCSMHINYIEGDRINQPLILTDFIDSMTRLCHIIATGESQSNYTFKTISSYDEPCRTRGTHTTWRSDNYLKQAFYWLGSFVPFAGICPYKVPWGKQLLQVPVTDPECTITITTRDIISDFVSIVLEQQSELQQFCIEQRMDTVLRMTDEHRQHLKYLISYMTRELAPEYTQKLDDMLKDKSSPIANFGSKSVNMKVAGVYAIYPASRLDNVPFRAVTEDVHVVKYRHFIKHKEKPCYYYNLIPEVVLDYPYDATAWDSENQLKIVINRYLIDLGCKRTQPADYSNLQTYLIENNVHSEYLTYQTYLKMWCSRVVKYTNAFRKGVSLNAQVTFGFTKKYLGVAELKNGIHYRERGRPINRNTYRCIGEIQRYIKVIEDAIYKLDIVAKKDNQYTRGEKIYRKFNSYHACISCDYSQFDGTIDEDAIREQYRLLESLMGLPCFWFQYGNKKKYIGDIIVECIGRRDSGEALTAVGNVLIVLGTILSDELLYQYFKQGRIDFYDDGDDNLVFCHPEDVPIVQERLVKVSTANHFKLKVDNVATELSQITFCKSHMAQLTNGKWILLRDVVPAVSKMLYTFHSPKERLFSDYIKTMMDCYDHVFGDIPLFVSLKQKLFQRFGYGHFNKMFYNEIKGRYYIDNSAPIPHFKYYWCDINEYIRLKVQLEEACDHITGGVYFDHNPQIDQEADPYEGKGRLMTKEEFYEHVTVASEFNFSNR